MCRRSGRARAGGAQDRRDLFAVGAADLDHGAEFFVEQGAHDASRSRGRQQVRALFSAIDIAGSGS
jgi:hypothetical protein